MLLHKPTGTLVCLWIGLWSVAASAEIRPATQSATIPASNPATAQALLREAELIAGRLPWLDQGFVSDRAPDYGPESAKVAALWARLRNPPQEVLNAKLRQEIDPALEQGPWSLDDIRPLLRHVDPKVRTMGIVLMYQLNRVDVLPELVDLLYDNASTFPRPANLDNSPPKGEQWPMEEQTVGTFARNAIGSYASASDEFKELAFDSLDSVPPREALRQTFIEFAKKRDPTLCTAALVVAMRRATNETAPIPDDRRERVRAVLHRLFEVPMPRRFFVALRLNFEGLHDDEYSADFLLQMAREVPRELRLATFTGGIPVEDVDLGRGFGVDYFQRHVTELFRDSDANFFLHLATENKSENASDYDETYAVLAARLQPAEADAILAASMDRIKGPMSDDVRENVALVMAEIGGEPSLKRSMDWFFHVRPAPGAYGFGRERWLGNLYQYSPARARQIHERIIRDSRLESLGPASTRILIEAVGGYLGRSLASEEEVRQSLRVDEAQRDEKFEHLHAWHTALKATVDEWSK